MAKLTAAQRTSLPASQFGVPSQRRFPIPDKPHAVAAKRLINKAKDLSPAERVNIIKLANAKLAGKGN